MNRKKNNAENAHEYSYETLDPNDVDVELHKINHPNKKLTYMWTYKEIVTDDWWPPNDDRVHLYSNGYLFEYASFKQIPINLDKAMLYDVKISTKPNKTFHMNNDYYSQKYTSWPLANETVRSRENLEYKETHNDYWHTHHEENGKRAISEL